MNERQRQYLDAMGVAVWVRRGSAPFVASCTASPAPTVVEATLAVEPMPIAAEPVVSAPQAAAPAPVDDVAAMDWTTLKSHVEHCTRCQELSACRTQTVFGVGKNDADWMVIGEAPGAEEEQCGEPFVGPAGQLLNEMLRAIGNPREKVYIATLLKSRLPDERDPTPEEVAQCEPYLRRQIQLVKPRIILAIGRISAQNLLKTDTPIGKLRGRVHEYEGTPLVVTCHPADLLRSPLEKRKAWDDLRLALKTFREHAQP